MLILFTGKGGVGKSTMAATTAVYHAKQGKNTILVSSDPAHSTDDVILQKVGFSPTKIEENLWAMNINAEKQAKELLTLPVHQYLSKKQMNFIVQKIENFYNK